MRMEADLEGLTRPFNLLEGEELSSLLNFLISDCAGDRKFLYGFSSLMMDESDFDEYVVAVYTGMFVAIEKCKETDKASADGLVKRTLAYPSMEFHKIYGSQRGTCISRIDLEDFRFYKNIPTPEEKDKYRLLGELLSL